MLGDFADVQKAVGAREKLNESAEFREAHDFAKIGFADFRAGSNVANHLQGATPPAPAGGKDGNGPASENSVLNPVASDMDLIFFAARTVKTRVFTLWNFSL